MESLRSSSITNYEGSLNSLNRPDSPSSNSMGTVETRVTTAAASLSDLNESFARAPTAPADLDLLYNSHSSAEPSLTPNRPTISYLDPLDFPLPLPIVNTVTAVARNLLPALQSESPKSPFTPLSVSHGNTSSVEERGPLDKKIEAAPSSEVCFTPVAFEE